MYRRLSRETLKFFSLSAFFILVSITILVFSASCLVVKPLNFIAPSASPIDAQIVLTAELVAADATLRTLNMNWYPGLAAGCNAESDFVADIYFDPDLLDSSSPSFTSLPPFSPAYQLNASQFCGGTSPVGFAAFRTVTKLLGSNLNPQISTAPSTLQEYPFDVYDAKFSIYALHHDSGEAISLNVTKSYGIAVNFEVTPTRTFVEGNVLPYLLIDLRVGRSKAAKGFVVTVAVSNWTVASAFLVISAATLLYPDPRHYGEMLILPIAVLFVCTSIRENLPGAPKVFGAHIDLYTILPVLVVAILYGFFLLIMVIWRCLVEGKSEDSSSLCNPAKGTGTVPSIASEITMQALALDSELGTIETEGIH